MNTAASSAKTTIDRLRERLAVLEPDRIEIRDDSRLHAGHAGAAGGGGHYRLYIVSHAFNEQRSLERHRKIFALCQDMMHKEIHALSIEALTPDEARLPRRNTR